jgi:hypothetical protein
VRTRASRGLALSLAAALAAASAYAQVPPAGPDASAPDPDASAADLDASAPDPDASAADPDAGADLDASASSGKEAIVSCTENVPAGATRPEIIEKFPTKGLSGWASHLEITLKHGKGETVLPDGFRVQTASDAGRALDVAGFVVPDPDGGSPPTIARETADGPGVTKLTIPFVPLPKDPGRNNMTLPPVPIVIARASGELVTVCTKPHLILVEDPTANEPDPKVKPNPPPRPQREDWEAARKVAIGILIGAIATAIGLWALRWWRKRPRVVKGPPPKLPWVLALEELAAIRRSSLLADGQGDQYYDLVSDSVRKYLGARYGFDGLEATTDEMHGFLIRVRPPISRMVEIMRFLEECDLVKFARVVPTDQDCTDALDRGETIVHMTMPHTRTREEAE